MKTFLKPQVLVTAFLLLLNCVTANAELDANMFIIGSVQGEIHGDLTKIGEQNAFEINEFHHLFQKGSDGSTTVHSVIVTTRLSKGMPLLLTAFANNEILDSVIINFYKAAGGPTINYYTIELTNGKLVMIEPIMLDNNISSNVATPMFVRLRFDYESIKHDNFYNETSTITNN